MSNLLQWSDVVLLEVFGDEGRRRVGGRGRGPRNRPLLRRALLHQPVVQVGVSQRQSRPRRGSDLVGVAHDRLQGDLQLQGLRFRGFGLRRPHTFAYFLSPSLSVAVSGAPQPIIELVQFTICEPKFNSKVDRRLCGAKITQSKIGSKTLLVTK